jgi:hypothetical protein
VKIKDLLFKLIYTCLYKSKIFTNIPKVSSNHQLVQGYANTRCQVTQLTRCKQKGKGHPITGHKGPTGGVEVKPYSFSTPARAGGGWSAPRPGRFTPEKYLVPIVQEAGWTPGPVWTCAKGEQMLWHLIFVVPECGDCFMSFIWCLEFLGAS